MKNIIKITLISTTLLFGNNAWSSKDFTQIESHLNNQEVQFGDIKINNSKAVDSQPTAFAVNVKGVIRNGVYDPYKSYTHELDNFDNLNYVAENPRENLRPYAVTWNADKSIVYALTREDDKYLLRINPQNGVSTRLSKLTGYPSNQMIQGMAIDENNTCYVIATDRMNHDTSSYLYTCNLNTGAVSLVGSQSIAPDLHDIAATCDGELYGVDSYSGKLFEIDKNNGSATLVGSLGLSGEKGLFTLTYDRQNGKLYQYVLHDTGFHTAFGSIDKNSGELTYLSSDFKFGIFVGGIESSCADQVETFELNAGFNGSWYNPETDGQGFLFDVLADSNTFFAAWFTYDDTAEAVNQVKAIGSSEQRWFTALGELGDTNTVELTVYNSSGGAFNDPTTVSSEAIGSMTVYFENCSEGVIEYSIYDGDQTGSIPIQRIAGDNIDLCESMIGAAVAQ